MLRGMTATPWNMKGTGFLPTAPGGAADGGGDDGPPGDRPEPPPGLGQPREKAKLQGYKKLKSGCVFTKNGKKKKAKCVDKDIAYFRSTSGSRFFAATPSLARFRLMLWVATCCGWSSVCSGTRSRVLVRNYSGEAGFDETQPVDLEPFDDYEWYPPPRRPLQRHRRRRDNGRSPEVDEYYSTCVDGQRLGRRPENQEINLRRR